MKIDAVRANNRRHAFELTTEAGVFPFPYAKLELIPSPADPIVKVYVDEELANEGFTYVLSSGAEDSVPLDQVLYYNEDPAYMHDMLLFDLTSEACRRIKNGRVSKREIIRRLGTSPAQFYRLIDTTNHTKSVDAMLELLRVLGCEVDVTVRDRRGHGAPLNDASICAEGDPIVYGAGAGTGAGL